MSTPLLEWELNTRAMADSRQGGRPRCAGSARVRRAAPAVSKGLRASLWPGAGVDLVRSDSPRCAARRLLHVRQQVGLIVSRRHDRHSAHRRSGDRSRTQPAEQRWGAARSDCTRLHADPSPSGVAGGFGPGPRTGRQGYPARRGQSRVPREHALEHDGLRQRGTLLREDRRRGQQRPDRERDREQRTSWKVTCQRP